MKNIKAYLCSKMVKSQPFGFSWLPSSVDTQNFYRKRHSKL